MRQLIYILALFIGLVACNSLLIPGPPLDIQHLFQPAVVDYHYPSGEQSLPPVHVLQPFFTELLHQRVQSPNAGFGVTFKYSRNAIDDTLARILNDRFMQAQISGNAVDVREATELYIFAKNSWTPAQIVYYMLPLSSSFTIHPDSLIRNTEELISYVVGLLEQYVEMTRVEHIQSGNDNIVNFKIAVCSNLYDDNMALDAKVMSRRNLIASSIERYRSHFSCSKLDFGVSGNHPSQLNSHIVTLSMTDIRKPRNGLLRYFDSVFTAAQVTNSLKFRTIEELDFLDTQNPISDAINYALQSDDIDQMLKIEAMIFKQLKREIIDPGGSSDFDEFSYVHRMRCFRSDLYQRFVIFAHKNQSKLIVRYQIMSIYNAALCGTMLTDAAVKYFDRSELNKEHYEHLLSRIRRFLFVEAERRNTFNTSFRRQLLAILMYNDASFAYVLKPDFGRNFFAFDNLSARWKEFVSQLASVPGGYYNFAQLYSARSANRLMKRISQSSSGSIDSLISLLSLSSFIIGAGENCDRTLRDAWFGLALTLYDEQRQSMSQTLLSMDFEFVRDFFGCFMSLYEMQLVRQGDALTTYAAFAHIFISRKVIKPLKTSEFDDLFDRKFTAIDVLDTSLPVDLEKIIKPSGSKYLVHGRTVYFKDRNFAVKLPKRGELKSNTLLTEAALIECFQCLKSEMNLRSTLPENGRICKCYVGRELYEKISPSFTDQTIKLDFYPHRDSPQALMYDPPTGYETPLHKVKSFQDFVLANRKITHDLAVLASRYELYSIAPSDLFHNKLSGRRYHWNCDMLQNVIRGDRFGSGRLDKWKEAIKHVNMGKSGIRDLKHYRTLSSIVNTPGSDNMVDFRENQMLAAISLQGDYLFAWVLSVGQWYVKRPDWDTQECAEVVKDGFVEFLNTYTQRKTDDFLEAAVSWTRICRQMRYFMTNEYIADVKKHKVSHEIYRESVYVEVDFESVGEMWTNELGWSQDGIRSDLGPYNGPFPIDELVRALYITTTMTTS